MLLLLLHTKILLIDQDSTLGSYSPRGKFVQNLYCKSKHKNIRCVYNGFSYSSTFKVILVKRSNNVHYFLILNYFFHQVPLRIV